MDFWFWRIKLKKINKKLKKMKRKFIKEFCWFQKKFKKLIKD